MSSEVFLPLQFKVCLQASWLIGAAGSTTINSQRCSMAFGPSPGVKYSWCSGWRWPWSLVSLDPNWNTWSSSCCSVTFLEDFKLTQGEALVPVWGGRGRWLGCLEMQNPDSSLWWMLKLRTFYACWRAPSVGCQGLAEVVGDDDLPAVIWG